MSGNLDTPRPPSISPPVHLDAVAVRTVADRLAILIADMARYEQRRKASLGPLALKAAHTATAMTALAVEQALQAKAPSNPDDWLDGPASMGGPGKSAWPVRQLLLLVKGARHYGVWEWNPRDPARDLSKLLAELRAVHEDLQRELPPAESTQRGDGAPGNGTATGKKHHAADVSGDERIVKAWNTRQYPTYEACASALGDGVTGEQIKKAVDRARHKRCQAPAPAGDGIAPETPCSTMDIATLMAPARDPAALFDVLDVRAVASLLGCSARHVYRLADAGKMPRPVKIGALVRWRRADLDSWLAAGCPTARRV